MGATGAASRPVDLAHSGDGGPGADHASTGPGTGSLASSESGDAHGPPGSASEGGVTLHASGDGGHLASGLATTWRIPGHGAVGGEHGQDGTEGGHDGLTIEMYQDVVVHQGADGMYSVNAVEYVVVRDEHGHAYVFRENYHTVVPDPPGQETDLVVHETNRVQVVEHPDGSFSVTQADNSISVTAGSDGDGHNEVTVTQTENVQIGQDPGAGGHDTASLTEIEDGSTTSDQTEVVSAGAPQPPGQEPAPPAQAEAPGGPPTQAGETSRQSDDGAVRGTAGPVTLPTASAAASSQVGTAPSTPPETFPAAQVMSAPPLATSLGVAATTAGGLTSGHEPNSPGAFAGLRGGPGRARSRCRSGRALPGRAGPGAAPGRRGVRLRVRVGGLKAVRASRRRSHRPTRRHRTRTRAPRSPAMTSPVSTNPAPTPASIWPPSTRPSPGPAPTPTASVSTKRQAGLTLTPRRTRRTRRPGTTPAPAPP